MIVQQVNLYQDRFREKRLWLSAAQVTTALLLVVAGIAIWGFLLHSDLQQAQQRNLAIKADQESMVAELAAANAELSRLLGDSRIDVEIEDVAHEISARKTVLNFVDANRFGSGEGFSSYLLALSKLHIDQVWLNQIRLGENFMHIKGSSLSAEQVPDYFERFSNEEIFRGSRFDLFKLNRDPNSKWKIDFEIATREEIGE